MRDKKLNYEIVNNDKVNDGIQIKIDRHVSLDMEKNSMDHLLDIGKDNLSLLRDSKLEQCQSIYEKINAVVEEWQAVAADVQLINRALAYIDAPSVIHTSNELMEISEDSEFFNYNLFSSSNYFEKSNQVYKFVYCVDEIEVRNPETKQYEVEAYQVHWKFGLNYNRDDNHKSSLIVKGGQSFKSFYTKEQATKYVDGRINKYRKCFSEINPPVPEFDAKYFTVNNKLLPNYKIEGKQIQLKVDSHKEEDKSILGKLTENKSKIKPSEKQKQLKDSLEK